MSVRSSICSCRNFGALAIAVLLGACASKPPEPITIEDTEEVSATVESLDVATRMATLRTPDGEKLTLQVSPNVQNLAQVKPGDRVVVRYYEALVAELRNRGDGSGVVEAPRTSAAAARAAAGARPGAAVETQTSQTVRITGVDKKNHVVSFYGSDGLARSVPILTPQGQEFAGKLKVGDEVELTYTEALAVSVEPSK